MTLGTRSAALTAAPLVQKLLLISFILGWSGLSIHAQVGSIIAHHGIPLWPYLLCRPLQGLLAAGFALIFFQGFSSVHTVWLSLMMPISSYSSAALLRWFCLTPWLVLVLLIGLSLLLALFTPIRRFSQRLFRRLNG